VHLKYLTANDWALLRSKARRLTFRPQEIIIAVNARPSALFVLERGSVSVEIIRGVSIARLAAGAIFGEMAFVEDSVASASVMAETETEVDALDLNDVKDIFTSYPHLEARFYKSIALLLSQRLRQTSAQLAKAKTTN
jgi:CRP/FNR family cyclic AMP-dependent transcriptional regulator